VNVAIDFVENALSQKPLLEVAEITVALAGNGAEHLTANYASHHVP
jgi:hypothetical protein